MAAVSLAEAQENLGDLIERVSRGETVEITRDGHTIARLGPPEIVSASIWKKEPIDFERLRLLREGMSPQDEDAGTFIRNMRDSDRY